MFNRNRTVSGGELLGAVIKTSDSRMDEDLRQLSRRVDKMTGESAQLCARVDGNLDSVRASLRELNATVAACVEVVLEGTDNADAPRAASKALRRALDDRLLFAESLAGSMIRALPLARIFPGIEGQSVEVGVIDPDTKLTQVDMLYVCAMARHLDARYIFEFGTYLGRTTYHLALGQHVKRLFTLDLDPADTHAADLKLGRAVRAVHERDLQGHFFRGQKRAGLITQLHGDSRTFDYSPYLKRMEFVFIDGGHSYEMVANDTEKAFSMLKSGGVVVWHDFAPKGRDVVEFARELSNTRPLFWIEDTSLLVYIDGVDALTFDAPIPVHDRSVLKPPNA